MDETASTLCEVIKYLRVDISERGGLRRNKSVVVRKKEEMWERKISESELFVLNVNTDFRRKHFLGCHWEILRSALPNINLPVSQWKRCWDYVLRKTIYNFLMKVLFLHQVKHLKNNIQPSELDKLNINYYWETRKCMGRLILLCFRIVLQTMILTQ